MKRVGGFISGFVLSFLIYISIVGKFSLEEIIAGLIVSLISSLLFVNMIPISLNAINPLRIIMFIIYIPYFLYQMIKANIQIALTVINPSLPINPDIIKTKTKLKKPISKLLLTSSITLTPGTLSTDIDEEEISIHYVKKPDAKDKETIRAFEKYIERISE
jgi:multicomponent Na+:H+ antiporter subunit E